MYNYVTTMKFDSEPAGGFIGLPVNDKDGNKVGEIASVKKIEDGVFDLTFELQNPIEEYEDSHLFSFDALYLA
jgi:hypothetical protein